MKHVHLRLISADNNNNRDYIMTQTGPDRWVAEYGRYGAQMFKKPYKMNMWEKIYEQKLCEGYTEITSLKQIIADRVCKYKEIVNNQVAKVVEKLLWYTNKTIESNYKIKTSEATIEMVEKAQSYMDLLSPTLPLDDFNKILEHLFTVLPRKMKNVKDYIAIEKSDYLSIIEREQDLLDAFYTKVLQETRSVKRINESSNKDEITILEEMGLEIEPCSETDITLIKKLLGKNAKQFDEAFLVRNIETEKMFIKHCKDNNIGTKDIHLLFHGSKNENFWSILCNGLKLRNNAKKTAHMFGHGLYFANLAQKSIGYTSLWGAHWTHGTSDEGYLAIFNVAYKNPLDVYKFNALYPQYTYDDINKQGKDALFAHAGSSIINDEIIIYNENQMTIKYLVRIK